jgi:erythronate-4-phosphate dehydrogenase
VFKEMKIVADDQIPFLRGVFEPFARVDYLPGNLISNTSLKDAVVLLTRSITMCDAELLRGTPVRLIATATIGDDHIDKQYCREHGIHWFTAKGCNARAVEQYVMTALVHYFSVTDTKAAGQFMGIIGVGDIGRKVQHTAGAMGLKTLLNDPPRERAEGPGLFSPLAQIRKQSDIISMHVPLNYGGKENTFHMLDDEFFERHAKPIVFINTARGAVVETGVLIRAKKAGLIGYLVLDVWENEPEIDQELLAVADIATPHIAGYSMEGKVNATGMVVRAVADFLGIGPLQWESTLTESASTLVLNCYGLGTEGVLERIFNTVFPIDKVSRELKSGKVSFGEMRRNYHFRRENPAYTLNLENCNPDTGRVLSGLGFRLGDGVQL